MTRLLLLVGVCIFTAEAGNQVLLRNLNPADGTPQVLAADRAGHLFVISTFTVASGHNATRAVELDLDGSWLASLDIPQIALPTAAVTDAQGNLIVAGLDASLQQGTIVKLDPQLHGTVFSKSLPANVNAAAVDGSGNIYITGTTNSAAFPVTAGAYQTKPPVGDNFGTAFYAVLSEISPGGDQLLYSTYFGGNYTNCFGGSACVGVYGRTSGTTIAVDSSGALVIAGTTDASDLPTTAGALAPTCLCTNHNYAGFIAKFQPSASQQLQWSTFLNATGGLPYSNVAVNSVALDAAGNVIVGGSAPSGLPTTAGTIQPAFIPVGGVGNGGFLVKLQNTGAAVIWGTYFGNSPLGYVKALRVDAQGQVLFTGATANPSVPALPNVPSFEETYVARMASDATTLTDFYQGLLGIVGQDLVLTATGGFAALGGLGTLWIETATPGPSLLAVTNSASGQYSTAVAPYELITLYGVGIGPKAPINGQVQNGIFTTSLGGCQVLFDGVAAPLLYADSGQINAVVPRAVYTSTHIKVVTPTGTVDGPTLPVSFQPGIFQNSQTGFAAALNQDGSVNSPSNPAKAGAIVAVFATGGGAGNFNDGALVPIGIYNASTSVWAGNQRSFEVVFAGDAPGLVVGVMQINFRLPDSLPPGNTLSFSLIIGGVSTSQNQIAAVP